VKACTTAAAPRINYRINGTRLATDRSPTQEVPEIILITQKNSKTEEAWDRIEHYHQEGTKKSTVCTA